MKLSTIKFLFISTTFLVVSDISMSGIKIGDPESALSKIKLEEVAKEDGMIKFRTENGNDFSITCDKGKVVYMENDWLQDDKSRKPLFSNFEFGTTSLKDIRKAFGSNGFTYQSRGSFTTDTHLIAFNCYEFDSTNNEVLIVITKVSLTADVDKNNIAEKLKLDALIIADKKYLDKAWGKEKLFDPENKKIKL